VSVKSKLNRFKYVTKKSHKAFNLTLVNSSRKRNWNTNSGRTGIPVHF